jgi:hypothetical protein
MNKHAEKAVKTSRPQEPRDSDVALDGVISAIHCCPGCGKVEAEVLTTAP